MKKNWITKLSIIFCLVVAIFNPAMVQGFVMENPQAGIQFWIPDAWSHQTSGEDLVISTPDQEVSMVMTTIDGNDVEAALNEAEKKIKEAVGEFTLQEPQETVLNGMNMINFDGQAMEGKMKLSISLLKTPVDRIFLIFAFATARAEQIYNRDFMDIINGLKPLTQKTPVAKSLFQKFQNPTVKPQPQNEVVADPGAPWAIGDTCYIEGKDVSLRAEPNTKSKLLLRLNYSDYGEVVGTGPRETIGKFGTFYWVKIRVGSKGVTGWVFGAFLRGEGGC